MKNFNLIILSVFIVCVLSTNVFSSQSTYLDTNAKVHFTAREKTALTLLRKWKKAGANPFMTANGKVTYVYGNSIPTIICVPFKIASVELHKHENIKTIIIGDSARFKHTISKMGDEFVGITPIVTFTCKNLGLQSNVLITTDRRVYHLSLKSQRNNVIEHTAFVYPDDEMKVFQEGEKRIKNTIQHMTTPDGFNLARLNFEYTLKSEDNKKYVCKTY